MKVITSIIFLAVLSLCGAKTQDFCTYTSLIGGYDYDLTNLINAEEDYSIKDHSSDHMFFFNICAGAHHDCDGPDQPQAVCQYTGDSTLSIAGTGAFNYMTFQDFNEHQDTGVIIHYDRGKTCGLIPRRTFIYVGCDHTLDSPVIDNVVEKVNCEYHINMRAKEGCPTNPSSSDSNPSNNKASNTFGWVFFGIILFSCIGYFGIGGGLLWKGGKRGLDIIPQREFWRSLPGYALDGMKISYSKISGKSSSYQGL